MTLSLLLLGSDISSCINAVPVLTFALCMKLPLRAFSRSSLSSPRARKHEIQSGRLMRPYVSTVDSKTVN